MGNIMSRHRSGGYATSGLAFDPTSSFVAGLSYADGGGGLMLWQMSPIQRFIPRPPVQDWPSRRLNPQDEVYGMMALTLIHEDLDRTGIVWPDRDLADTACMTIFCPDSRLVVFQLISSYSHCQLELVAYEVMSGKRLWCIRSESSTGGAIFSPDGSFLLIPEQEGTLGIYRVEDGLLLQRCPTGLSEPIQALSFDPDGKTLWLATAASLVQYVPQG